MIPAPLVAFIRYAVVWECARLTASGWSFFNFDPDTMNIVVNGLALVIACLGAYAATVAKRIAHLIAHHPVALVDAAAAVPGVTKIEATPAIAKATANDNVVAAPQSGAA